MKRQLLFIFFAISLSGCYVYNSSFIQINNDSVKGVKQIRREFTYANVMEWDSPFMSNTQTIVKEIDKNNVQSYTIYENLKLKINSFDLEQTVYLIIGEKSYPIKIEMQENTIRHDFSENTKSILTADSTKITVVTGYTNVNWRNITYSYNLPSQVISEILNAQEIRFRYYAGPVWMTTRLSGLSLKRLKQLIVMS